MPVFALQFTQSALDCMGVEVSRLRAFLQVRGAVWGSVGLGRAPWGSVGLPVTPGSSSELRCLRPGRAGGVRPAAAAEGPGHVLQRHPPVLQEDPAPHARDGRAGDPRGAGLRAAGERGVVSLGGMQTGTCNLLFSSPQFLSVFLLLLVLPRDQLK